MAVSKKIKNAIKFIVIASVFWVPLFGLAQTNIDVSMMDGKVNCPFGGHSVTICQMNPMEHIQEWQNMFTTLPAKDALLILFVLVALLALRKLIPWGKILSPQLSHKYFRLLVLDNFQVIHPLQEAFSSGILNPKLF